MANSPQRSEKSESVLRKDRGVHSPNRLSVAVRHSPPSLLSVSSELNGITGSGLTDNRLTQVGMSSKKKGGAPKEFSEYTCRNADGMFVRLGFG